MRYSKILIIVGMAVVLFGIVFQFQGKGQIGPESSFMYKSEEWVDYGYAIMACGMAIAGVGIWIDHLSKTM
ncbi:MAG: hypothetical protein QW177_09255 [Candidatus Nitrosotenuis sp.]